MPCQRRHCAKPPAAPGADVTGEERERQTGLTPGCALHACHPRAEYVLNHTIATLSESGISQVALWCALSPPPPPPHNLSRGV